MGFDLIGSEDSTGFNVWCWHPMWYFCHQQGWIDEDQYKNGKENSGFKIDEATTSRLAREMENMLNLDNVEQIIENTTKEFNLKVANEIKNPEMMILMLFGGFNEDGKDFEIC